MVLLVKSNAVIFAVIVTDGVSTVNYQASLDKSDNLVKINSAQTASTNSSIVFQNFDTSTTAIFLDNCQAVVSTSAPGTNPTKK